MKKKNLFHLSVTSFLCCFYLSPLIFSRWSCFFPHCLCSCRSAALCWWSPGVSLVSLESCMVWNWPHFGAKSQDDAEQHLKALHPSWLSHDFLPSYQYFLLPLGLIFSFLPAVSFHLRFFRNWLNQPHSTYLGRPCHNLFIFIYNRLYIWCNPVWLIRH